MKQISSENIEYFKKLYEKFNLNYEDFNHQIIMLNDIFFVLDKVKQIQLIVNVPPGYGKTSGMLLTARY